MRRPCLALMLVACGSSPPRPEPAPVTVPTDAAVADVPAVDATEDATPLHAKHWDPPPQPPQSASWSLDVPAFGPHGSTSESLDLGEDGFGRYDRHGSGTSEQGDVDPGPELRCDGRIPPAQHVALVAAVRKVVTVACAKDQRVRRGVATLTMSYVHDKATKRCIVDRAHADYAAYETIHEQVIDALCKQ